MKLKSRKGFNKFVACVVALTLNPISEILQYILSKYKLILFLRKPLSMKPSNFSVRPSTNSTYNPNSSNNGERIK
jgi:hypothetical protein